MSGSSTIWFSGGGVHELLITCDFVCHGVGSQAIFEKFIHYYEALSNAETKKILFRSKHRGYLNSSFVIEYRNGKKTIMPSYKNGFGYAFSCGMINRLSCAQCQFASLDRVSDITLCDCIHGLNLYEKRYGCSNVLVNTEQGLNYIDQAELVLNEISVLSVVQKQSHLSSPQPVHAWREAVMRDINESYEKIYYSYLQPPKRNIYKSIKERIKYARTKRRKD